MFIHLSDPKFNWVLVDKSAPIRAILIQEGSVLDGVIIHTLEGDETAHVGDVLATGVVGEQWLMTRSYLELNYIQQGVDEQGVSIYIPAAGGPVREAIQITHEWCEHNDYPTSSSKFSIPALWGEMTADGKFAQHGSIGDWVVRNQHHKQDMWIVREDIFTKSYRVL